MEKLVWVSVISFCKIFIPSYLFDGLIPMPKPVALNPQLHPHCVTLQITLFCQRKCVGQWTTYLIYFLKGKAIYKVSTNKSNVVYISLQCKYLQYTLLWAMHARNLKGIEKIEIHNAHYQARMLLFLPFQISNILSLWQATYKKCTSNVVLC